MPRTYMSQIALYSDPQSQSEYEALIAALYKKARALNGLHQHTQEEVGGWLGGVTGSVTLAGTPAWP